MEPFTIQCTTCSSSIRVRNPDLIGQVAHCPKCQSMIMIALPTQVTVKPKGEAPVDSTALTREVVAEGEITPGEYSEDDAYRLAPQEPFVNTEEASEDASSVAADNDWRPGDIPLVPSDDWASESTARTKQYILVGILGLSGVIVAVVGFLAFLNWYNDSGDVPMSVAGGQQAVESAEENLSSDAAEESDLPDAAPQEPDPPEPAPASELNQADAANAPRGIGEPDTPENSAAIETLPPSLAGGDNSASPDPANNSDPSEDDSPDAVGLPEQLRAMEELLGGYEVPLTLSDEGIVPSQAPLSASELGLAATVGLDPLEPADIAAQSSKTLHALAISKPPSLSRFINLWTHLSGMPLVVDFSSLATAGIDRNAPLVLPSAIHRKTFGEILSGIAKINGMKTQVIENRLVRLQAANSDHVPATINIGDLVADSNEQAWLAAVLQSFYLPNADADAAKAIRVGEGQLAYDSSMLDSATWGEIVRTIETWRSLSTGSTSDFVKVPEQFLVRLLHDDRKLTQLEHVTEMVSPQSRPVGQVLSKLCEEAGLHCWIDWSAVGAVGLGPQTTQLVVTRGRTLRRILADYARIYPLRVAILDDSSIWITSPKAYRSTIQVFVLPAEGKTAMQWQSELRRLTPSYVSDSPESSASRSVLTELSPDRQFVFVRSCLPAVDLER